MNLNLNISIHPLSTDGRLLTVGSVVDLPDPARPTVAATPAMPDVPIGRRFVKIGSDGNDLADDAIGHVAFRHASGKLFHVLPMDKGVNQREAEKRGAGVRLFGRTDWLLAEIDDLELMRDRSRFNPACHAVLAGDIKPEWYWSRTPGASDPSGCAWLLVFYRGYSSISYRGYGYGFVVAVAPAGQ